MSRQARVDSFSALSEFRASLATFASIAAVALDEAGTDIQRTLLWLREDRQRYWKAQVHTRAQQYTQAKLALKQHEVLDRAIAGSRSACVEERRAVKITEKRLREAEHTFRLVRIYLNQLEKESQDFKGTIHGLVNAIEVDIPNACASLDRMVAFLQQYVALAPPEMPSGPREGLESSVLQPFDMPPAENDGAEAPSETKETSQHERQAQ